jgi:hypothetical protein
VGWKGNIGEGKEGDKGILEWKIKWGNSCNVKEREEG